MSTDRSRRAGTDDADLDAHALLGTSPASSERDLRRAYRRALLRAHPDQGGDRAELEAVQDAFARLSGRTGSPPSSELDRPTQDIGPRPAAAGRTAPNAASVHERATVDTYRAHATAAPAATPTTATTGATPSTASTATTVATPSSASAATTVATPSAAATARAKPMPRAATIAYQTAVSLDRAFGGDDGRTRRSRRPSTSGRFAAVLDRELVRRSGRRVRLVGEPA